MPFASLFTDEMCEYFSEHNINILISFDGTPEIHNRSRKFAATGGGTYDTIVANLRRIRGKYPEFYKKLSFNVVIDPRYSEKNLHEMFTNEDIFKDANVQSTLISDLFFIEKSIPSEEFIIEDRKLDFLAELSTLGRYPKEKASKLKLSQIKAEEDRTEKELTPSTQLPDEVSHSGPCIPGQKRLFVDVDGNFFPCERVSETSNIMKIGNLRDGFAYEKALKLLNVCRLTEDECRECWALRHCSICARVCDNSGEFAYVR